MKPAESYTLFDSPLGKCGIGWTNEGIRRLQLPERDEVATERQIARHGGQPANPPAFVLEALQQVRDHLGGRPQSFATVRLDLSAVTPFYSRVYQEARSIPCGQVRAYGDLAVALGQGGAARAVGQALSRNPIPIIIPCHRILTCEGKGGGFSAFGGLSTKAALLAIEGVTLGRAQLPVVRSLSCLWDVDGLLLGVDTLKRGDERLAILLTQVGACTLTQAHPGNPFAALVESIIYQQLAGRAAAAIVARFEATVGSALTPAATLAAPTEAWRSAGLSAAKMTAIQSLAHAVLEGLDLESLSRADDDEIKRVLTGLKGIGPWTVDMFLIFHLGRADVFPLGDLGIRKAMQRLYRLRHLPDAARLEKLTARWKPYRTIATWYLWRSLGVVTLGVAGVTMHRPQPSVP